MLVAATGHGLQKGNAQSVLTSIWQEEACSTGSLCGPEWGLAVTHCATHLPSWVLYPQGALLAEDPGGCQMHCEVA